MKYKAEQFTWDDIDKHMMDVTKRECPPECVFPMDFRYDINSKYIKKSVVGFNIKEESIFNTHVDAYVNSINCQGVMGAGIALEFKKKFPNMFADYKIQCNQHLIKPGDAYLYRESKGYIIGLAVKQDWRHWSTLEWLESSIKSLKLAILENDIKSANLPVIGGQNGRRGPFGKVNGMTPPPEFDDIVKLLQLRLEPFANKFGIEVNLCIPPKVKPQKIETNDFFS